MLCCDIKVYMKYLKHYLSYYNGEFILQMKFKKKLLELGERDVQLKIVNIFISPKKLFMY